MVDLPVPLTPPDCNLRGMPFMPLQVVTLLDSDLFALSTGDEFKAAVALWCKSWNQIPGGSLPNDERILAAFSQTKNWKKVKEMAMRGWILCDDNRFYHPVVAENVLKAWESREEYQEKESNKDDRQKRWRERCKALSNQLRSLGVTPPKGAGLETLEALLRNTLVTKNVDTGVDAGESRVDAGEMPNKREGYREGQGERELTTPSSSSETSTSVGASQAEDRDDKIPEEPGIERSRSVQIAILLRSLNVRPMTSMHPTCIDWAMNPKITDKVLHAAIEQARQYKPEGEIHPHYLAPIVTELLQPKRDDNSWKRSNEGIERKGRELGLFATRNEDYKGFADRISKEIDKRKRDGGATA